MDSYNFDRIGKKMPYRVPDNFFDDVEKKIISRTTDRRNKRGVLKVFYHIAAAAAVIAFLVAVGNPGLFTHKTDFAEIAQAFDSLSDADQSYILEIYPEDIFIDQQ